MSPANIAVAPATPSRLHIAVAKSENNVVNVKQCAVLAAIAEAAISGR